MTFWNHQGFFIAFALLYLLYIPSTSSFQKYDLWEDSLKLTTYQPGQNYKGLSNIKSYLHQLGYIPNAPSSKFDDNFDDSLVSAILTYQNWYNLNPTGRLDRDTLRLLMTPRCGVPDIINPNTKTSFGIHTVSHYKTTGRRWDYGVSNLTYGFATKNQLSVASKTTIKNGIERWKTAVNITYREVAYSTSQFKISFEDTYHGDAPFKPTTLAHAFYPKDGRLHFNKNFKWVTMSSDKDAIDLESVTTHESGHLLGLNHSQVEQAIMYPTYESRKVILSQDDIDGIQSIYPERASNLN